jgi:uncharacterized delta-60 repeat protein
MKTAIRWIAAPAVAGALALTAAPASAAPGDPVNQMNFQLAEIALQSGKTLLAGTAGTDLGLIRLNADGSPDRSFDVEGFARADFGSAEQAADIALASGSRIVIAGTQDPGVSPVAVLAAFNPDGSPDATFSGDGEATMPLANGDTVTSVDVSAGGRIAVGVTAGNGDFKVIAFTAAGAPDAGFGAGGVATLNFGGTDQVTAVAFQSTGKVVAAGGSTKFTGDFVLARFGLNGAIDNAADVDPGVTFNGAGAQEIDASGGGVDRVLGMAIDTADRIVLTGLTGSGAFGANSGTVRVAANGAWETTFAGDGKAEFPEGLFSHAAEDIAITAAGDIVVAGIGHEATGFGYVQRLSAAGTQTFASTDTGAGVYDTLVSMRVATAPDGGFTLGSTATEYPAGIQGGSFAHRFTAANASDPTLSSDGIVFPRFLEEAPPVVTPPNQLPAVQTPTIQPPTGSAAPRGKKCKRKKKSKKRAAAAIPSRARAKCKKAKRR